MRINEKDYEIKINKGRVKVLEKTGDNRPIINQLLGPEYNGLMSLTDMERVYQHCLKEPGADAFVSPKEGAELFDADIEARGYKAIAADILAAASEGLPFLFKMS